jgi:uncharacterized membrane protein YcaP (DUF421 family)
LSENYIYLIKVDFINEILGSQDGELSWYQMAVRAAIAYFAVLLMIRFGNKRFLGKLTSHDIILAIILGSIVSRGITGPSPLFATLITATILVVLHGILSYGAIKFDFISNLLKGSKRTLIEDGKMDKDAMKQSRITEDDIMMEARKNGIIEMDDIQYAYLERSGDISIIRK